MASIRAALCRVKEDPGTVLSREHVYAACQEANHRFRDRKLDPFLTIVSMVVQVLHGNTAIGHVVRLMHSSFNESAFCQARTRLPLEVLRLLLGKQTLGLRQTLADPTTPGLWRGRRTLLIDGSGFSMPDTAALAAFFGLGAGQRPGCGFPVGHMVAMFDAATGLLLDLTTAAGRAGDLTMAAAMRAWLRRGDILVGDRGFCSYAHLAVLQTLGVDGVFRLHRQRELSGVIRRKHRRRRDNGSYIQESVLVRRISADDHIVEWPKPIKLAAWLTRAQQRLLPGFMRVRVIRFKVPRPGWRTRNVVLATTLLNPESYSADEIAQLYMVRWNVEINFRHLKQTMGMNVLRCKSVTGVEKEVAIFALVYNLVRLTMLDAAARQGVPPDRISFVDAMRWLQTAADDDPAPIFKVNPKRPERFEPRLIKRRASRAYGLLTRPRDRTRKYLTSHPRLI
jgi:hypothetical protein